MGSRETKDSSGVPCSPWAPWGARGHTWGLAGEAQHHNKSISVFQCSSSWSLLCCSVGTTAPQMASPRTPGLGPGGAEAQWALGPKDPGGYGALGRLWDPYGSHLGGHGPMGPCPLGPRPLGTRTLVATPPKGKPHKPHKPYKHHKPQQAQQAPQGHSPHLRHLGAPGALMFCGPREPCAWVCAGMETSSNRLP